MYRHFTKSFKSIVSISDLSYLERLAVLDLGPIELRRIKSDLTMCYKINNKMSAFPSNYLPRNNSIRTYYSRTKCEYIIPNTAILPYSVVCKRLRMADR